MVAAYTTRIRLTKQGDGDNDSTWGTVLNDEVIDLTDFAIAGYTTVNLASGDATLTSNDGAPDESRSAMLELTGTLTGNRDVYIPGVSKSYIVRNNTSGAYSATVKVTGGTGYAVPQGKSAIIYSDSVSVRDVSYGNMTGPDSSTDNALVLFDGTSGQLLQDSTYTITGAGAALLDDANAAAQRETLGIATQAWSGILLLPTDKTYRLVIKCPFAGVINSVTTKCASGSATGTFKINSTALGGTANAISTSEQSQAHSSANAFSVGQDIQVTISSNSACVDASFTIEYTR